LTYTALALMAKWAVVMRIPISTTGSRGFSVIELLVVLLIIGVIASIATLSINTARPSTTQILYSQLQNQLELAQKIAQLKNIHLRLIVETSQSTVEQLNPITQQWFESTEIPSLQYQDILVQSSVGQIIISPSGYTTPAILSVTLGNESYQLNNQ